MNLQFKSISSKINAGLIAISLISLLISSLALYIYSKNIQMDVYERTKNELIHDATKRIEFKMRVGLRNALSLASDERIINSLLNDDRILATNSLVDISNKMKKFREFKNIKIHLHSKDSKSFLINDKEEKHIVDLTNFSKSVASVNKSHESIVSFEHTKAGLLLRAITPVMKDKKHLGSLEFTQALDSVAKACDKKNRGFLVLLDENLYIDKNSAKGIKFQKNKKLQNYKISQKLINKDFLYDAQRLDIDKLFQEGFLLTPKNFYTYIDIKDFKHNKIGIFLLSESYKEVHRTLDQVDVLISISLISIVLMALVISVFMFVFINLLIINPLKKVKKGLYDLFTHPQGKNNHPKIIDISSNDELGEISNYINENIEVSVQLHKKLNLLNSNLEEDRNFEAIRNDSKNTITMLDLKSLYGSSIMLCEDSTMIQEIIVGLLDDFGINIDIANNGKEALQLYEANHSKYELILMDIKMPIMDGYEATRRLRELDKEIPIIDLSANNMKEDMQKAKIVGMNGHLNKPIDSTKLYEVLLKHISKKSNQSEFEHINTNLGIAHLNGNKKLYLNILKNFYITYRDIELDKLDATEFKRWTHTLKGLSINIGALDLHKIAKMVDETQDRELLKELNLELNFVLDDLSELAESKKDEDICSLTLSDEDRELFFIQLATAIESKNPKECETIIKKIQKYQLSSKDAQVFKKTRVLIENYNFREAIKIIGKHNEQ